MAGGPGSGKGKGSALGVIFGIAALDLLGFGIVIPQLGIWGARYGASPTVIGLLLSSYSVMQFLSAPVLGRLSDRFGRRPILLFSTAGSLVGYVLFAFAHSLPLLFLSRIIAGIAGGNISTAQAYISDVTSREERAKGMGMIGMAFGLGFIFGPALGGALGALGGNLAIGLGAAALSALNLTFAWFVLAESRQPGAEPMHGERLGAIRAQLTRREVGGLLIVALLFTTAFAQMEGTLSAFLLARHTPTAAGDTPGMFAAMPTGEAVQVAAGQRRAAVVFTVVGVVSALVQGMFIGRLKRRFGEVWLIRAGIAITALGLLLVPVAPTYLLLFAPMVLLAIGAGLTNPSMSALVSIRAADRRQGEALGAYQAMGSLGRIAGPIVGGFTFARAGAGAPYFVAGSMSLACLAVAAWATRAPPAKEIRS